jgi:hypothetical protein
VRGVVVAPTVKLTDPRPDIPPLVTVIQATGLVAVQVQPDPVTTEILLLSPVIGAATVVGETLYVQLLVDWLTVTIWPPTIIVPVRGAPVPFAATVKLNDPSPDMPPLVILTHATVLVGVHEQLDPVTTEILLLSPVDGADTVVGETL